MSAATMMALSADEIRDGRSLPGRPHRDPQMTISTPSGPRSASAQAIKDQFEMVLAQCQDPKNLAAWTPILRDYSPGLLATCDHAALRAKQIVATALEKYMLAGADDPATAAGEAAEWLYHAAMLTLGQTGTTKLIENHRGRAWVNQVQPMITIQPQPGGPQPPGSPAGGLPPRKRPPPPPPKKRRR